MHTIRWVRALLPAIVGLFFQVSLAAAQSNSTTLSTSAFTSGGAKITLDRYEPCAAGKHPTIMLVHGMQSVESSKTALDAICRYHAARGYAVFLIHYFDRTRTEDKEIAQLLNVFTAFLKDGKPDDTASKKYSAWLDTLRDGLAHIRTQPKVDSDRIGLMGLSLGSFMSLSLAAEEDLRISAVVSYFGGMSRDVAARVTKMPPIQMFHGDKDLVVPVSEAHALMKLADAKKFHLEPHIFPNAGHLFVGPTGGFQMSDAMQAGAKTACFLDEKLKQLR